MRITVHIPKALALEVEQLANHEGASVSSFFAKAMKHYLKDYKRQKLLPMSISSSGLVTFKKILTKH